MVFDLDFAGRYRAVQGRDPRFDGWFFTAVTSTGIYCRPSCPATTPRVEHVRFYPTAAAAQEAGFRACKRCLPGAVPGSPAWDLAGDLPGRAMRLIADGVVEREGVPGLARRVGYSERQVRRHLLADLGAGPLALARAQRAHVARLLLETTDLQVTVVAFAAGFGSLRQFNATIREVFAATPTALREDRRPGGVAPGGRIVLRLARRAPFAWPALLRFLALRAVPGVEEVVDQVYRRSIRLPHGPAIVELSDDGEAVRCVLALADPRDLGPAVARCRRLLDLDADPVAVGETLGRDPLLADLVRAEPGRRSPGAVDGTEMAARAVLGQGITVAAARTLAARLVAAHGTPLAVPSGGITHLFPAAPDLAAIDPATLPGPAARRSALHGVAEALATGRLALDAGADRFEAAGRLQAIRGIGPWTAGYVAMRALGDPDAFLPGDVALRDALNRRGGPADPRGIAALAARWRPWRSYAVHHLWASLDATTAVPTRANHDGDTSMTTTLYARHPSPLGLLLLVGERTPDGGTVLAGCYLPGHRRGPAVDAAWVEDRAAFAVIGAAIDAELAGLPASAPVALVFRGGTPFQRRVWEELRTIPRGSTVTYGELAARIGMPGAARAVGSAVARNPVSIVVPCHRVVGADGSLTGYAGGVERKRALLEMEGAVVGGVSVATR